MISRLSGPDQVQLPQADAEQGARAGQSAALPGSDLLFIYSRMDFKMPTFYRAPLASSEWMKRIKFCAFQLCDRLFLDWDE